MNQRLIKVEDQQFLTGLKLNLLPVAVDRVLRQRLKVDQGLDLFYKVTLFLLLVISVYLWWDHLCQFVDHRAALFIVTVVRWLGLVQDRTLDLRRWSLLTLWQTDLCVTVHRHRCLDCLAASSK